MSLSCDYDYEPEAGDWMWFWPETVSPLIRRRSIKCCSCGARIKPGDLAAEWRRMKIPSHEIEIAIYGEDGEIALASWFMCQTCGNTALFLRGFKYYFQPTDSMAALVKEHAAMAQAGRAGCL